MDRPSLPGVAVPALAAAALLAVGCAESPPKTGRTNLLLITLDTLRADHLGCYGYERRTSPALDRLAAGSVLFEQAIAQSAVTPVSHASILTGLNPYRHGLRSLHGGVGYALDPARLTLAEALRERGHATAGFVSAFPATSHYGLEQGFEFWDEDLGVATPAGLLNERGIVDTGLAQRRGDVTTDAVLEWLDRSDPRPFFVWVHYFDAHDPLLLPPPRYVARFPPTSSDQSEVLRGIYDAEIAFVDAQVARLLARIEQLGLAESTIVVVVSDHGEGLGDHGWWGHTLLYQEQVRVPLLIRVPGLAGRRVGGVARTVDLVPTLAELLGLGDAFEGVDGRSLVGALRDGSVPREPAYSETINDLAAYHETAFARDSLYALNDGRYKLLLRRRGGADTGIALYDLEQDPVEQRNLWPEQPGPAHALRAWLDSVPAILETPATAELEPAVRRRLQTLGYVK